MSIKDERKKITFFSQVELYDYVLINYSKWQFFLLNYTQKKHWGLTREQSHFKTF